MLNTEKLDCLQKRLEFWDREGNPVTVNTGLELVALTRKELEAERLEREAEWLAERLKEACKSLGCLDCPFYDVEADYCFYDEKPWREVACEAVEATHAE